MSTLTLRNVKGTPLTNTEVDTNFSNLNTDKLEKDGSNSMTGKLTTVTSSASTASIRVVAGSADPSSPVSGDVWNNAGDFKFYTGAATRVLTTLDGAQTLTNKTLDAALVTNGLFFEGATADNFETLLTVVDPTADRTVTIPDATTTMVGTDVSQTLTNKTIALGSNTITGTSAQLATAISDETGSGALVFASSPTLVTPALGTPSSGDLANCTFPTLNQNTSGSAATFTSTSQDSQFNSIGVGTAASATTGEIRATNEITAFFSDARLKNFHGTIPNALDKVTSLNGYYFTENEVAKSLGYTNDKQQVGVSAQEVEAVLPEAVAPAPIDEQYLTVKYEKLVPLLIEAIKEQQKKIEELEAKINKQ